MMIQSAHPSGTTTCWAADLHAPGESERDFTCSRARLKLELHKSSSLGATCMTVSAAKWGLAKRDRKAIALNASVRLTRNPGYIRGRAQYSRNILATSQRTPRQSCSQPTGLPSCSDNIAVSFMDCGCIHLQPSSHNSYYLPCIRLSRCDGCACHLILDTCREPT